MRRFWSLVLVCSMIFSLVGLPSTVNAATKLLAFPGAEGGGKYTTGARNGIPTVYRVTNLNARGTGSFADAISRSNRIIVFDVGGTINLSGGLSISKPNLTILGQTAPGDGITFAGGDIAINADNIIMRYVRIRPSDINGGEPDGLGGRWVDNIMLDHCSVSWSVDEGLTLYAGSTEDGTPSTNVTMQYCLGSESLRMSNHIKGAHGYGAIWGATNASYHHNLLAHHDSRSPRLDRELVSTDIENNVIYDWGNTNSAYGGEPYSYNNKTQNPSNVNYAYNYYKYGPGTASGLRSRIFDVSNNEGVYPYSNFYFNGNYVFGNSTVTNDNSKGINNSSYANLLTSPVNMGEYTLPAQTAEEAYNDVLKNAGATLPRRDSIDARIVADVKNGTGRIVNKIEEVGGFIDFTTSTDNKHTYTDANNNFISDDWESTNNMPSSASNSAINPNTGYTWIEDYANDIVAKASAPSNPDITVVSPAVQSTSSSDKWAVIKTNETVNYKAIAAPIGDTTITKMELYDGTKKIKDYSGASSIDDNISLPAGVHYLASRAYNSKGESTTSPTSIVYVNDIATSGSWKFTEIGSPAFAGQGSASLDTSNGVYTVSGSGSISGSSDKCDYMYKEVTGDFILVAEISSIPKYENGVLAGLMLRETLDPNSRMVMLSDTWLKYGENIVTAIRSSNGGSASVPGYMKNSSGATVENTSGVNYEMPKYMKMERKGYDITLSVSNDGKTWTNNIRQPLKTTLSSLSDKVYVGIAVDSVQGTPTKDYYTIAQFGSLSLNGESDVMKPSVEFSTLKNGMSVAGGFEVAVNAKVAGSVALKAEFYVDGTLKKTLTSVNVSDIKFTVPQDITAGNHALRVDVYDQGGVLGSAEVTTFVKPAPAPAIVSAISDIPVQSIYTNKFDNDSDLLSTLADMTTDYEFFDFGVSNMSDNNVYELTQKKPTVDSSDTTLVPSGTKTFDYIWKFDKGLSGGKKYEVSFNMYMPSALNTSSDGQMEIYLNGSDGNTNNRIKMSSDGRIDMWSTKGTANAYTSYNIEKDKWYKIKLVADTNTSNANGNYIKTGYYIYDDTGALVGSNTTSYAYLSTSGDISNLAFRPNRKGGEISVYLDNMYVVNQAALSQENNPTVTITSPADNTIVDKGSKIIAEVVAGDSSLQKAELYIGGNKVDTVTDFSTSNIEFTIPSSAQSGKQILKVILYDELVQVSDEMSIRIKPDISTTLNCGLGAIKQINGKNIKLNVNVANNYFTPASGYLVVGVYDKSSGELIKLATKQLDVGEDGIDTTVSIDLDVDYDSTKHEIRAFLWNSYGAMKPLSNRLSL